MSVATRVAPLPFAKAPTRCVNRCLNGGAFLSLSCSEKSFRHRLLLSPTFSSPEETVILANTSTANREDDLPPVSDTSLDVKKRSVELCSALKGTSIFLIGASCSLKREIGKLIADAFSYYFFDSDEVVVQAFGGESSAKVMKENAESDYNESETEVFKQLTGMGRLVVCAGNGAVRSSTNLGLLRHGITIWIDVPLDMIDASGEVDDYDALRGGYSTADAAVSLQRVARKMGYDEVGDVTVEDMVVEAFKEIEKLTRVKKMIEEAGIPF